MTPSVWIFIAYVVLSFYDLGMAWVLQLMHYPLYRNIGPLEFSDYIRANNARAFIPAILPALASLAVSILLAWRRAGIVTPLLAWTGVTLNVVVLLSTVVWQGRLHGQLSSAKSDRAIDLLVRTNWIRTAAFTAQAVIAVTLLTKALAKGF